MPTYKATITPNDTVEPHVRIVEAKSPAQVIQHVAKSTIAVEKISAKEAFELGKAGVELEDATAEPAPSSDSTDNSDPSDV